MQPPLNPLPPPSRAPLPDPQKPPTPGASPHDNTMGGMIPTQNQPALWSYYLGLFSIFPVLGLPMAVVALVQGRKGLKLFRAQPQAKGRTHAMVGLGCGTVGLLLNLFIVGGILLAVLLRD